MRQVEDTHANQWFVFYFDFKTPGISDSMRQIPARE